MDEAAASLGYSYGEGQQQHQWVGVARLLGSGQQGSDYLQEGGGGVHGGADPWDPDGSVQLLIANQQHRNLMEGIAAGCELAA